jgi:hypothetical protein
MKDRTDKAAFPSSGELEPLFGKKLIALEIANLSEHLDCPVCAEICM